MTIIGGSLAALVLVYLMFFVFPALDNIKKEKVKIEANRKTRVKLKDLLESRTKIPASAAPRKKFEGSLTAYVEKMANEREIKLSYVRPYGKTGEGVEIKIDEILGKDLIDFAYEMEQSGVTISRLNARDYKGSGFWVVKMNLEKNVGTKET